VDFHELRQGFIPPDPEVIQIQQFVAMLAKNEKFD
jgi:hypothetical protein